MAYIKHPSRTWGKILVLDFALLVFICLGRAQAEFTSQFTLSVGEEFNDNIFFDDSDHREHDFITFIVPTFSFSYVFPAEVTPRFTIAISPVGYLYARHSEENTFHFSFVGGFAHFRKHSLRREPRVRSMEWSSNRISSAGKTEPAFQH
jgi:hypothetical protein